MKSIKHSVIFVIFFLLTMPLFAKTDGKVLVYYFKNLTGNPLYNDLIYSIPLCIYERARQYNGDLKLSVIEKKPFIAYLENDSFDLWNSDYLLNSTRNWSIKRILYGFFYSENGRLRIRGKIYFTDSGLILDITEDNDVWIPVFREIEELSLEEIRACGESSGVKTYRFPAKLIGSKESARSKNVLNLGFGAMYPTSDWGDLYSLGVYSDLSYTFFAKRNMVPIGVGPHVSFIFFGRQEDGDFIGSNLLIVPVGGSLRYVLIGKNMKDKLIASFSAGLALSILNINHDSDDSIDFYSKGSLSLIFTVKRNYQIAVKGGLFSVSYDEKPLNAFFSEIGFRSFFF